MEANTRPLRALLVLCLPLVLLMACTEPWRAQGVYALAPQRDDSLWRHHAWRFGRAVQWDGHDWQLDQWWSRDSAGRDTVWHTLAFGHLLYTDTAGPALTSAATTTAWHTHHTRLAPADSAAFYRRTQRPEVLRVLPYGPRGWLQLSATPTGLRLSLRPHLPATQALARTPSALLTSDSVRTVEWTRLHPPMQPPQP